MAWTPFEFADRHRLNAPQSAALVERIRSLVGRICFGIRPGLRGMAVLAAALFAIGATIMPVSAEDPAGPSAYRLGVFPYVPVLTIDRIYGPVAAQFSEDLGRPVHLKTKASFEKFAEEIAKESYDVILVHPFFYVEAHDEYQYLPLARVEEPLTAVVMVDADNPAETLADLEGQTIALPPELAAVSHMVKASIHEAGLVPGVNIRLDHKRSKLSCLDEVAIGRAAACGLPEFALSQIDPDNDRNLRRMFTTPGIKGFVFAVHARVPEADRSNLWKSILAWPYTARGRAILRGGAWTRFVRAEDEEYDEVRRYALRLRMLAQK
ncbi:MAG: phosphate/phosphite/phosphonate ABC transporter substrate-binding protein [Pseudomonadota bacterium]